MSYLIRTISYNLKTGEKKVIKEEVKEGYDVAMVAPQVRHRFEYLKEYADAANVPCALIQPQAYSPLGGPKLLKQVKDLVEAK